MGPSGGPVDVRDAATAIGCRAVGRMAVSRIKGSKVPTGRDGVRATLLKPASIGLPVSDEDFVGVFGLSTIAFSSSRRRLLL